MQINELFTPCLLLDEQVMQRNIERMQQHVSVDGCTLRPHLKTSKCLEIADAITRGHSRAITVSTLREAEYFGGHGYHDILYSAAPSPNKLPFVIRLLLQGIDLKILADNPASVAAIIQHGARSGLRIPVLLEIDCDGHRSGLPPDIDTVAPLARILKESLGAEFCGIMTHAGSAYDCKSTEAIRAAADAERNTLLRLAGELELAGLPCRIVSIGSTPTAVLGSAFSGISEVRAGAFVFNDLTMVNLGVCNVSDVAISVLCSVIGHRPSANQVVTDAGWMALSADLSTQTQATDYRFGLVCDGLTGARLEDLLAVGTNQEHGLVGPRHGEALDLSQFPVGRLLRIVPVHACATAAAHGSYQVIRGPSVVAEWKRIGGW